MSLADYTSLFRRWLCILRVYGFGAFITQGFLFLIQFFFSYQPLYLYRATLDDRLDEVECIANGSDFTLKVIVSNKQAAELVASGFDFGPFVVRADRRLDRGAIAVCAFVKRKLSHISWVAMTQEAKDSITAIPYPVDFSNKEAFLGRTVKDPRYQRAGNFSASIIYFKALQFLWHSGKKSCRFVVSKDNHITQNTLAKRIGIKPCGEGRYLKILCWKSWRERPI